MTELTNEIIREQCLHYSGRSRGNWEFIESELVDYSEGYVYHTYVYKNTETGEFWAFGHSSNSWTEYDDDEPFEPYRVVPKEVTVTAYVRAEA
jgi:hypothetical protein